MTKHSDRPKDQEFIQGLFLDLRNELHVRYLWDQFPDINLLYAIVFAKKVPLDDIVQLCITRSILLNSIETCLSKVANILPVASLTTLAAIKDDENCESNRLTEDIYKDACEEIVKLAGVGEAKKISFDSLVVKWMKYKWLIAKAANKNIKLAELLGISEKTMNRFDFENIRNMLNLTVTTSVPTARDFEYLEFNSNKNTAGHMREVKEIRVNAINRMAVRRGAKDDKFDLLLIIYQGEGLESLRLYFDHKSLSSSNTLFVDIYSNMKMELHRYQNVKSMCEEAGVPFMFCLLTHYPGLLSEKEKYCLILREDESKAFFSLLWPLFMN